MRDTEIVIKGEVHTSNGDLDEEREILRKGVDHLILEGPEDNNWEFKPLQYWFAWMLLIFEFLFARLIYVDKAVLKDLADVQGAETQFTRESDTAILENSRTMVKVVAALLFFLLLIVAIGIGLVGYTLTGALFLLMSSLLPLLLLRIHESRRRESGRDEQIAQQVEDVARDGGRVVAIVGQAHAKRLPKLLPDDLPDPEVKPPAYQPLSWPSIRELIYPGLVLFSVLYIVYSGLLAYVAYFL